jgi:hypothetical protein
MKLLSPSPLGEGFRERWILKDKSKIIKAIEKMNY